MNRKYNVFSTFDGISCGMLALERAGINVNEYYTSEIDPYTESISEYHYPNMIRLGDITKITQSEIDKLPVIDLYIGGSPCQNLSSCNVFNREGLDGEKSSLFYDYVRILEMLKLKNPNIKFLLENVGSATIEDRKIVQSSLFGIEKKPLPHLLCMTNLLLHDLDSPNILRDNSLSSNIRDYTEKDKYDLNLIQNYYLHRIETEFIGRI